MKQHPPHRLAHLLTYLLAVDLGRDHPRVHPLHATGPIRLNWRVSQSVLLLDPATDTPTADWYAIIVRNQSRKVNPPFKLVIRTTVPYAPHLSFLSDKADWYDWNNEGEFSTCAEV